MRDSPSWLNRRVVLAILGAVAIGVLGAALAIHATPRSSTATTKAPVTQGKTPTPSAKPTVTATSPTTTVTASPSQPTSLEGTILDVGASANAFTIALDDQSVVGVVVTDSTLYSGDAGSLADLQVGMSVKVTGQYVSTDTFQADSVYATFGD